MATKHTRRRRWAEAVLFALAGALGVVQAMPPETPPFRLACAMLAAGIPVLLVHMRHGQGDAAAVPGAAP